MQRIAHAINVMDATGKRVAYYLVPARLYAVGDAELKSYADTVLTVHNSNPENEEGVSTDITFADLADGVYMPTEGESQQKSGG